MYRVGAVVRTGNPSTQQLGQGAREFEASLSYRVRKVPSQKTNKIFHHATQNSMQLKTYELFISGIFLLVFLICWSLVSQLWKENRGGRRLLWVNSEVTEQECCWISEASLLLSASGKQAKIRKREGPRAQPPPALTGCPFPKAVCGHPSLIWFVIPFSWGLGLLAAFSLW